MHRPHRGPTTPPDNWALFISHCRANGLKTVATIALDLRAKGWTFDEMADSLSASVERDRAMADYKVERKANKCADKKGKR